MFTRCRISIFSLKVLKNYIAILFEMLLLMLRACTKQVFNATIRYSVQMTANFNALGANNQLYCWIIGNKYIIKCKMLKNTAKLDIECTQQVQNSVASSAAFQSDE